MRVVGFGHGVGDGQLKLVRPEPRCFAAADQPKSGSEVQQNGCGLTHHDLAMNQKRRRKGRLRGGLAFHHAHHGFCTLAFFIAARDVDVIGTGGFKGQSNEFASALDRRPIVQLVAHGSSAFSDISAAIWRSARANTSGGWPPEIKCRSLTMTAGTE